MALSRLLLITCALLVGLCGTTQAQSTTANQDGILVMDSLGQFYTAPMNNGTIGSFLFQELVSSGQSFGFPFPVAKDLEIVSNPDGSPKGAYMLDAFGGQHALNVVPESGTVTSPIPNPYQFGQFNSTFSIPPYFGFDVAEDIEVAPDWRDVTHGFRGYFVLDADGVVHPVGETNLPQYAFFANPNSTDITDATLFQTLFPETIDVSGSNISRNALLQNGPIRIPVNRQYVANQLVSSVTPIYTYFGGGSDIARDLEVSVEFINITVPSSQGIVSRTIAMTNGYYILDGLGAVHSARLPLDFDTNNDGLVLFDDLYTDLANGTLNPDFGTPINNIVMSVPWVGERNRGNLPYFGSDVAVDIEITPSGRGFYLLDAYGGIFAVGDAHFLFPPKIINGQEVRTVGTTPYFGIPIARDLKVVANAANPTLGLTENTRAVGLLVLDGFGTLHAAGVAETFDISETGNNGEPITAFSDSFRAVETTPAWNPAAPVPQFFSVGSEDVPADVAPGYRNVTAAFSSVSAPQ